jgi:hypothetical protein
VHPLGAHGVFPGEAVAGKQGSGIHRMQSSNARGSKAAAGNDIKWRGAGTKRRVSLVDQACSSVLKAQEPCLTGHQRGCSRGHCQARANSSIKALAGLLILVVLQHSP